MRKSEVLIKFLTLKKRADESRHSAPLKSNEFFPTHTHNSSFYPERLVLLAVTLGVQHTADTHTALPRIQMPHQRANSICRFDDLCEMRKKGIDDSICFFKKAEHESFAFF